MKSAHIKNNYLELTVLEYGARIHQLSFKDHLGTQDLVHCLAHKEDYLKDTTHLNAAVGRFAGRICSDRISIKGQSYDLNTTDGIHLHGGEGFAYKYWTIDNITKGATPSIQLSYLSPHMENGYPGQLKVSLTYTLKGKSLAIEYQATTDQTTLVNLSHHAYFKLDDSMEFNHLQFNIPADQFIETDKDLCPTGTLTELNNHPLDFRSKKALGTMQLDTPFVIDNSKQIEVFSPKTKLRLKTETNQNIAVVYTPESGVGFCVETQNYPNSPNRKNFPSAELNPGEIYKNLTTYEFVRESN